MNRNRTTPQWPIPPRASVTELLADLSAGKMVILLDAAERKNEAKLVLAAECANASAINFMAKHGKGLICLALSRQRCQELGLALQGTTVACQQPCRANGLAFTVSIEAAEGVSTGISAADRALTIQRAVKGRPRDIVQPGHVFPLQAVEGGVWMRPGHTEAGCDLAALAGYEAAAVICAILRADGSVAQEKDIAAFAREHQLKVGHINDVIAYRIRHETWVHRVATQTICTHYGECVAHAYREVCIGRLHIALVKGSWNPNEAIYVRIHDAVSALDVLSTKSHCSHEASLHTTLCQMQQQSKGVVILLDCSESSQRIFESLASVQKNSLCQQAQGEMLAWQRHGVSLHILRDCKVSKPDFSHDRLSLAKKGGRLSELTV